VAVHWEKWIFDFICPDFKINYYEAKLAQDN